MKRLLAIILCLMLVLTACGVKTKDQYDDKTPDKPSSQQSGSREPIDITILSMSNFETEANVVRDQLQKIGFNVTMNIQADYGGLKTIQDSGNFDLKVGTWKVLTGNPDYGLRSLFKTESSSSIGANDKKLDDLIELAATKLPEDALDTYKEIENYAIKENAYIAPVSRIMYMYGLNKEVVKEDTVQIGRSKNLSWSELDFVNEADRETRPLVLASNRSVGSFDPTIQIGTFRFIGNSNIKLIELTADDKLTTDRALAQAFAIAEGNSDFYIVLRDNINFSTAVGKKAVDTGVKVSANDVLYTIERLKDKNASPGHRVYDNYQIVKGAELVTDLSVLENAKESSSGKTIKEVLEKDLKTPIKSLALNEKEVNNAEGKYEVIKLSTNSAFPQILNYFTTYEAGILCEEQVKSINNFDMTKYDPDKDSLYADGKFLKEGPDYKDGHLYCSGPYTILYHNDYEVVCERNPGFMPGTDSVPSIKNVKIKIIKDSDAQVSALRSGEIDLIEDVSSNSTNTIKEDPKLALKTNLINGIYMISFNMKDGKIAQDVNIRQAVLNAINQDDVIAVKEGMAGKAYSTLTMLETGNEHKTDVEKAKEYLDKYYQSKEK